MEEKEEAKSKKKLNSPDCYFRPAQEIRKTLKISEEGYRRISATSYIHPRDLYIYGVLDELEKAGMAVMRYEELIEDDGKDIVVDSRIERNIFLAIRDEQNLYVRKLIETFAELINFQQTNTEDYFRHYFLIKELDDEKKKINNLKKYYECEDKNSTSLRDALVKDIDNLENNGTIDLAKCWYLSSKKPNKKKPETFDMILEKAISQSSNTAEKIALGTSYYTAYTVPSYGIHLNVGISRYDVSRKDIETGIAYIGLVSSHILVKCRKLLGHRKKGWVSFIKRVLETSRRQNDNFRKQLNPKMKVGDFVIATNELAQIIKVKMSKFGYKSFLVRYIAPSCNLVHKENWVMALHIRLYTERESIARGVYKLVKSDGKPEPSKRRINKSVLDTVIDMWENMGQKEYFHGRPDLARQKIEVTLKARKERRTTLGA